MARSMSSSWATGTWWSWPEIADGKPPPGKEELSLLAPTPDRGARWKTSHRATEIAEIDPFPCILRPALWVSVWEKLAMAEPLCVPPYGTIRSPSPPV
jgi:hypothetical protein